MSPLPPYTVKHELNLQRVSETYWKQRHLNNNINNNKNNNKNNYKNTRYVVSWTVLINKHCVTTLYINISFFLLFYVLLLWGNYVIP